MKDSLSRLVIPTAIIFVGLSLTTGVRCQTSQTSPILPCANENVAGRPTLKRRQATQDNSSRDESGQPNEIATQKPCAPNKTNSDSTADQNPVIVRFEGLRAFSDSNVLKLFREKRVAFPKDRMPDRDLIEKALAVLKESFQSHGYERAIVDARSDEQSRAIIFFVDEGPRLQIAELKFEGNKIFSSQELAAKMHEYLDKYESSRTGYDAEILEYCRHSLANYVRSRGYLQAQFGEPKKEVNAQGLIITIHVDEGSLYRVGEIGIEGAEAVPLEKVKAMLSLQSGEIANGEVLAKWLYEDLKKSYGELGYIQYTAEVTPEFKSTSEGEGVVNFKIEIDEGRRFKVRAIEFVGDNLSQQDLKGFLLIREGVIFNQRLFEDSISRLNQTGLFDFVDKDRDVDFRSNEEEGLMDLVIKLTRKGPPGS